MLCYGDWVEGKVPGNDHYYDAGIGEVCTEHYSKCGGPGPAG